MVFGIDDAVAQVSGVVGKVIDRIWPDPTVNAQMKTDLAKAQMDGSLKEYLADSDLIKAQLAVNQAEAANPNIFVAGWRPFIGWTCGSVFAFNFIGAPVATWATTLFGHPTPMPTLDFGSMLPILLGMLGLGAMRTTEKLNGLTPGE